MLRGRLMSTAIIWEKHVEWEFARNYVNTGRAVTPLDGTKEYGDAILATDSVWWILEFKASDTKSTTERDKYPCFSVDRALAIAGRNKQKGTPSYKALEAALAGRVSPYFITRALLQWERHCIPKTYKLGVFHRAFEATKWLVENYQFFGDAGKLSVGEAPHLFVYPSDELLTRLSAHRYWTGLMEYKGSKVKVPSISKDLAVHLASKAPLTKFIDYVVQLATARGYLTVSSTTGVWSVRDKNHLGNVLAYGRLADGTTVMLPLSDILDLLPQLANKIQLPLSRARKP